jgi:hypothetical protein
MGLHGRSSDPDLGELGEYLKDHYGITRAQHLWQLLGIESVSLAGEIKLPGSEFGVPIKPPKPEPVRSEDWGSW